MEEVETLGLRDLVLLLQAEQANDAPGENFIECDEENLHYKTIQIILLYFLYFFYIVT